MLRTRVIPCLLVKDGGLVKTRRFEKPVYVGDPINTVRIFNEKECDELMVLDIGASRNATDPDYRLIEEISGECFMPVCYGGGVRTIEQAHRIFSLGIEKVCIQTAALADITLITEIAARFGSQAVVVSVDVRRDWRRRPRLYTAARGANAAESWLEFMRRAVAAGAGEVVLNVVDRDGTLEGVDSELIAEAAAAIEVPLIALGGVGSLADIRNAVEAGASAVAAGAFFVFHGPHRAVLITYPSYAELKDLLG